MYEIETDHEHGQQIGELRMDGVEERRTVDKAAKSTCLVVCQHQISPELFNLCSSAQDEG